MPKVESSNIDSYDYNPLTKEMSVTFKSGSKYTYKDVPQETVQGFADAPSKGSFLYRNIRDQFQFEKVE